MPVRTRGPVNETNEVKSKPSRRLVVELGRRADADLAWLVNEEEVNKTTLVNRAIQVYRILVETQKNGGSIMVTDPVRGDSIMHIVT